MICSNDCLRGTFSGNLDVRNTHPGHGFYELVINVHAYNLDKFMLKMISVGDLVLKSEVFEESKGFWLFFEILVAIKAF